MAMGALTRAEEASKTFEARLKRHLKERAREKERKTPTAVAIEAFSEKKL
jgi:hypothetical protein